MVGYLKRVIMCKPETAGWRTCGQRWRELGFLDRPNFKLAYAQHEALEQKLQAIGTQIVYLQSGNDLSMDAVYVHDASFITNFGVIVLRMGKSYRGEEPRHHRSFYEHHQIPIAAEIQCPGNAEAGDMIWLDERTILVGRGYRTNAHGIEQLRALFQPKGIEVIVAPLPHYLGTSSCLHLMSLISLLDEHTALVDLPWLAVETVELLRKRSFNLIEIDPEERGTLGCNVLALGDKRLLAIRENRSTNKRLRKAGFDVQTFPAGEVGVNGGGGPTCLTRPLLRHQ